MATKILELPLFEGTNFSYSIPLEGNTYTLKFTFIDRIQDWTFCLKDSERNILFSGQRLTPNTELAFAYRFSELTGYFYLNPKASSEIVKSNLAESYNLYYVFDDGE